MFAKVLSASCIGIDAFSIEIEVDISSNLPEIVIVGLPDQAVRESKDRIKTAIKNSGLDFPARRKILINLAPANMKKEGPSFDLPIAIGILAARGQVNRERLKHFSLIGELALDGTVRGVKGVLPIALSLIEREQSLIIPRINQHEAALQEAVTIYPVQSLREAVDFINNERTIKPFKKSFASYEKKYVTYPYDFSEVRGQQSVKRALEIAVSGAHNIMMVGSPGSGKTMLARRLPSIFPDLTQEEALEITKIHSAHGALLQEGRVHFYRPFRAPHHTISAVALAGGGQLPRPGEVSLAHNGVLFLDEFAEFNRSVLEVLRAPMEDGMVTVARAKQVLTFPAQFMLVCAMNPCPCGFLGDERKECICPHTRIEKYMAKISGPLIDRLDMHIEVRRLHVDELRGKHIAESSGQIHARVNKVRAIQANRFIQVKNVRFNAHMGPREIEKWCPLTSHAEELLHRTVKELAFSARAYHKVLKIARTIRDMKESETRAVESKNASLLHTEDVAEALYYRILDRKECWGR